MHRLHRRLPYKGHHRPALPDTRKCISYLTIALKTAIPSSSERPSVIASTALTTASSSAHRTSLRARPRCTILSEEMGWIQQRWWSFLHGQKRTLTNDCKAARSGALAGCAGGAQLGTVGGLPHRGFGRHYFGQRWAVHAGYFVGSAVLHGAQHIGRGRVVFVGRTGRLTARHCG